MGLCLISSKEISEYRRRWNAMLVDLRNPKAYRQWHIPEAQNVPLEELELFMEQVPKMQKLLRKLGDPEITFEDAIKISQEYIEIYRKVNEDRKKLGKPIFKIPKLEKE